MAVGTRWNVKRMEAKFSRALDAANIDPEWRYTMAAAQVADETHDRIRDSGRGGDHNAEFANIEYRVFRSRANRWNILVGWLRPPEHAAERGTRGRLWYQYQDSGFHLFGGPDWKRGVEATNDQRERLIDAIEEVNHQLVDRIARILNS